MLRAYISLIRIHKTIPTLTKRYFANGPSSLNHHYSPSITNINNFNSTNTRFPNKSNFKTISQSKQNKQFQNRSFGSYNTDRKNKAALVCTQRIVNTPLSTNSGVVAHFLAPAGTSLGHAVPLGGQSSAIQTSRGPLPGGLDVPNDWSGQEAIYYFTEYSV